MKKLFRNVTLAAVAVFTAAMMETTALADSSTWTLSLDPTAQVLPDGSWLTTAQFSCDPGTPATISVTLQDLVTSQDLGSGATSATCDGTSQVADIVVPNAQSDTGCVEALSHIMNDKAYEEVIIHNPICRK